MNHSSKTKRQNTLTLLAMAAVILSLLAGTWFYTFAEIPDRYYANEGEPVTISSFFDITAAVTNETEDSYDLDVKYLGILPVKTVTVDIVRPVSVVPGGQTFGLRLYTDGVVVVGVSEDDTSRSAGYTAGLRKGDVIKKADGLSVTSNAQLNRLVRDSGGKEMVLTVQRDGTEKIFTVKPRKTDEGYKLGLWIRDSIAGIGTVTYYDTQNGRFAALGHSITDSDTGDVLPLLTGNVFSATVTGVNKGRSGAPGELKGLFMEDEPIGTLYENADEGVFGVYDEEFRVTGNALPVAYKQDVHTGDAQILCTVAGSDVKLYDIRIERVMLGSGQTTKNMLLRVTDPALLEATGGIVQGMSGSPILQDGKIIGAVTHVLVSSPDTGYGIFIENMINNE